MLEQNSGCFFVVSCGLHDLKTDTKVFQDVLDGNKTFEIRFNDRDFQVGDSVLLKETQFTGEQIESGQPLIFTGREIHKRISYLLSGYGLQDGWVILGIADEAGQQSQQAKIDELQKRIDDLEQNKICIRNILGKLDAAESKLNKIAIQAQKKLETFGSALRFKDAVQDILKGNKDEK